MAKAYVQKITANTPADQALDIMEEDGAVIITGMINDEAYRNWRSELDPDFAQANFCKGLFYGEKTKRIHSLARKSKTCRDLMVQPLVLQITNGLLGKHCDKIQINLTQGIQIWPGEKAQVLHRDDSMFPITKKTFEFMINAMWSYTDFTSENGATIVVPGSHKWDPDRRPLEDEITQAEMKVGEVLVYRGSLIHAGGRNKSSSPRTGIALSYCLGWIRQSENQYFAAPPEIARHFSKELQDLLGYCVQRPNLGMYEGGEPNILFAEKQEKILTRDWLTPEQEEMLRQYHAGDEKLIAA